MPPRCAAALAGANADAIVHLAAQSLPGVSWDDPAGTMRINVEGTRHLLEAVRALPGARPRVLVAGSSAQYASSADGSPIAEDSPTEPASPYGISKLAADALARLWARAHKLDVVTFRPFFWVGTRKTGDVSSDLARRIVGIERGAPPVLTVGRTDVVRDFIDVRDGVAALLLLLRAGTAGQAYNICRGSGTAIAELIAVYRSLATVAFDVQDDPALTRPVDEPVRIGDPGRIRALGWQPRIPLEQSLRDVLAYWRGIA